jgi:hypothetical protein
MLRNEELDLLHSAELKQAFDEFDKVILEKIEPLTSGRLILPEDAYLYTLDILDERICWHFGSRVREGWPVA